MIFLYIFHLPVNEIFHWLHQEFQMFYHIHQLLYSVYYHLFWPILEWCLLELTSFVIASLAHQYNVSKYLVINPYFLRKKCVYKFHNHKTHCLLQIIFVFLQIIINIFKILKVCNNSIFSPWLSIFLDKNIANLWIEKITLFWSYQTKTWKS